MTAAALRTFGEFGELPRRFLVVLAVLMLLIAGDLEAAHIASQMMVSVIVKNSCTADTDVNFENPQYAEIAPSKAAGEIAIHCSYNTPYALSLNAGVVSGSHGTKDFKTLDPDTQSYQLFRDPEHQAAWGKPTGIHELSNTYDEPAPPTALYGKPIASSEANTAPTKILTVTVNF